ncbi:MAG TPA: hypothetical protein VIK51_11565, partial [Vicinamibacteria bacterium]
MNADATATRGWRQRVDDGRGDSDVERVDAADETARFQAGQLGRARHHHEPGPTPVGQKGLELSQLARDVHEIGAQLTKADHLAILEEEAHERVHPFETRRGHGKKPEHVTGRGGIDDHHRLRLSGRTRHQDVGDGEQSQELVDPRRSQIHQILDDRTVEGEVETRATAQLGEDTVDGVEIAPAAVCEEGAGVQLTRP